jgi:hypothetical protein
MKLASSLSMGVVSVALCAASLAVHFNWISVVGILVGAMAVGLVGYQLQFKRLA